jgi:hypothetical protein
VAVPFKSKAQAAYMAIHHPGVHKKWIRKYGKKYIKNLPKHTRSVGAKYYKSKQKKKGTSRKTTPKRR